MTRETARRDQLLAAATDHVLEHGLIGLSLRPLAAALGTSDRMLLYHFEGKDDLVAAVLDASNDRAVRLVRSLPEQTSVRAEVVALWEASTSTELDRCQRLYVEAAALGLFGREPYASVVRRANAAWVASVADRLRAAGMPQELSDRAVVLLDAAFMGFQLDVPLESRPAMDQAVSDLADALEALAVRP